MSMRRIVSLGSIIGVSAAALGAAGPVAADSASEGSPGGVFGAAADSVSGTIDIDRVPEAEQDETGEYWTPERRAAAVPADPVVVEDVDDATLEDILTEIESANPRTVLPLSQRQDPADSPHIGKVFFSTDQGDFVCSGNLVASANQSTVSTAGHCMHDGDGGDFATNFAFAPAYDHGESENGLWVAEELMAPSQWTQDGDLQFDVGFAVMETQDGATVEQEVGASSPIAFNQPRNEFYTAYGYPAAFPFNGEELRQCQGNAIDDPLGGSTQGIPCDMTGGSSGGPWFLGDGPDGAQNSVNSYKYIFDPTTMYGPYFGSEIEEVYDVASTR